MNSAGDLAFVIALGPITDQITCSHFMGTVSKIFLEMENCYYLLFLIIKKPLQHLPKMTKSGNANRMM